MSEERKAFEAFMADKWPGAPLDNLCSTRAWDAWRASREQALGEAADIPRKLQRCTCPATPGHVRTIHEAWCPWAIKDAIEAMRAKP